MAEYAEVAQRTDQADAEMAKDDQALAAMEADLMAAEARIEAAAARYERARRVIERELAEMVTAVEAKPAGQPAASDGGAVVDEDARADKVPTQRESHATKNTSARSEKEISRDKWEAARAAEGRVRERAVKARERLRRCARDRKLQAAELPAGEAPAPAATEEAGPEVSQSATPKPRGAEVAETPAVKEGAQGIAARLACLKDRPNAAEKRAALVKVVTCGRENYYTFEPADVLQDLKGRGLLENGAVEELSALLAEPAAAPKPAEVPAEGWAAGAKKASEFERLDDKPFREAEGAYLRFVEGKSLASAEAELEAAEVQLGEVLRQAEARYGELPKDAPEPAKPVVAREPEVDLDEAERLEAQHDPDAHRESRGLKNTSALSSKVVSKERWESARCKEERDREHEKIAREARRAEARDLKQGAADVPDGDA
uniref:Uncharacterized protein n=1 Tax=Alexandrium monilatum TaxID=311494 RepID=A0A6T1IIZ3_9DINO